MEQNCLNCNAATTNKFCANCGQKTDTHRIVLKNFVLHDVLHGVWHIERGILFTLREAVARPGQAALDYIGGKRIQYYNVFYLSLLLIGLNIVLAHSYEKIIPSTVASTNEDSIRAIDFLSENVKFVILGLLPVLSLTALLFFKRLRLNLAEHLIISGMSLLGILIISLLFVFVKFMLRYDNASDFFGILKMILFFAMYFYPAWTYYNATRKKYTFWAFLWRIVLYYVLITLQLIAILGIIVVCVSGNPELEVFI